VSPLENHCSGFRGLRAMSWTSPDEVFAGAMALPNDGRAIRLHGDPDPGEVDRRKGPHQAVNLDCAASEVIPPSPEMRR
jgi:hypothetical protein